MQIYPFSLHRPLGCTSCDFYSRTTPSDQSRCSLLAFLLFGPSTLRADHRQRKREQGALSTSTSLASFLFFFGSTTLLADCRQRTWELVKSHHLHVVVASRCGACRANLPFPAASANGCNSCDAERHRVINPDVHGLPTFTSWLPVGVVLALQIYAFPLHQPSVQSLRFLQPGDTERSIQMCKVCLFFLDPRGWWQSAAREHASR